MSKILSNLIAKKFSVYVSGEFERLTDFIGFMKLLSIYSDFFQYSKSEQYKYLKTLLSERAVAVDSNIFIKLGK